MSIVHYESGRTEARRDTIQLLQTIISLPAYLAGNIVRYSRQILTPSLSETKLEKALTQNA